MTIKDQLRRVVPMRLRLLRSRWQHRLLNDQAHRELRGRHDFFLAACRAIVFNGIAGDYAEFGCCGGDTFSMAHNAFKALDRVNTKLWAFDSFAGLPPQSLPEDEHPVWVEGDMAITVEDFHAVCRSHGMKTGRDYEVIQGFYNATLADISTERNDRPRDIALAYIDCDLYTSTMDVLRFLEPRFKHGMIIAFDDYYCWTETAISGERNACNEVFAGHPRFRLLPYIQFGWHGMSFIIEDRAMLKRGEVGIHY